MEILDLWPTSRGFSGIVRVDQHLETVDFNGLGEPVWAAISLNNFWPLSADEMERAVLGWKRMERIYATGRP